MKLQKFTRVVVLFVGILILGFAGMVDAAITTNSATSLVLPNQTIKANSTSTAVLGFNLVSSSETLSSVNINIVGSGGFSTTTDLATLSTATSSGVAIYRDNKAAGTKGSFDALDVVVPLSSATWTGATTTLTLAGAEIVPIDNAGNNAGSDYFIVIRTSVTATDGHIAVVSIYPGQIGWSANTPGASPTKTSTSGLTIDTVAPTIDTTRTGPGNGATNVPISAFINVSFLENIDPATINASNVSLSTGTTSAGIAFRTFPDSFSVITSNPPAYQPSSRFATVSGATFGFYNIAPSLTITPFGAYTTPVAGDIVFFQHDTFPVELGIITDATLTGGTFSINGFALMGGQIIIKFASPTNTGPVTDATTVGIGDLVLVNTTANPTSDRYAWHIASTSAAINSANLRLDTANAAPSYVSGSSFSSLMPTATSTVNSANQLVAGLNFIQGDLVFAKVTTGADNLNNYAWHLVTTAENVAPGAIPATLRLDSSSVATVFAANGVIAKLSSGSQGLATDTLTTLSFGDLLFAKTLNAAANNGSYNFHLVSNAATGVGSANLRLDNSSSDLLTSTNYALTVGTGVTDKAGNPLASNQVISFSTGATGSTNTTPPFVTSSNPGNGVQNFPTNALINIQFSQAMAVSGLGSVLDTTNVGLFLDNFGVPGAAVSASNAYNSDTRTVTISPTAVLSTGTGYVLKVNPSTKSALGASMSNFQATFRTGSGSDSTKPTVMGAFPSASATAVARNINAIGIGFSEDMSPASISSTTVTLSGNITGIVGYNPTSRSAYFSPTMLLAANTSYTLTVTSGATDLAGNVLDQDSGTGGNQNFTSTFTTNSATDSTGPTVMSANADNFGVAITFSESIKSGGGPNAGDNIANYTLESPTGSTISLGGKTVAYDGQTMTAKITGLTLQNGNTFKVTVSNLVQDLSNNALLTTGTPAANLALGSVANSSMTGGSLGPGSGPQQSSGTQGMSPVRVSPSVRAAGLASAYAVEFPVSTSIPSGGSIVLTFPAGFVVNSAVAATAGTESFRNGDINGPSSGTVTIASVTANASAGTITIVTGGAATGANTFVSFDLNGIVNSTIPSSTGYSVDIRTRDTSANNNTVLETKTSAPFYLGQTGSITLSVQVFHDDNSDGLKDSGEEITGARVFLFSPALGGQSTTTVATGVATFNSLTAGDYMLGIDPSSIGSYPVNPSPQPITLAASATKKYALAAAGSTLTISGTVTGPAGTSVDVFAGGQNGFTKTAVVLSGNADNYSLPVQANTTYQVGVGPAMPSSFMAPGAPPPPPPTFNFMPPASLEVKVLAANITGKNFILSGTSKTITGSVLDSSGNAVNTAGVFARPVSDSTTASSSSIGFGTGGQTNSSGAFTLNVVPGVYLVGVFKPGMPNVSDKQITVPVTGNNNPTALIFKLGADTSLTIAGGIKDDSGNPIPYSGVSGRKVTSTSDTNAIGGGAQNFVSGQSDANGAYTLYVSAGTWVVEAYAPGFGKLGTKTLTVGSSSLTGQDFSAQTLSLGTITGSSTRATVAQQGVMVRAESSSGGNMAATDSSGSYALKVPAGTYTVTCFFPGIGESTPITSVAVTANNTTSGQNCALAAPITINVNLTDGTNPINGAFVDVRDANGRGNGTGASTASSTASTYAVYSVSVPPGTYTVRVGHPAYGQIGSTTGVNTTRGINYTASVGVLNTVTGTIQSSGSALSGAWVSMFGTPTGQTNPINMGTQSSTTGAFSMSVPTGSYRLRVDKPGYRSSETAVSVSTATNVGTINASQSTRSITGTVLLNGSAVSNAFVDANDGSGGFSVGQTDSTGAYGLSVDNGTWTIRAHSLGYSGGPVSVSVSNVSLSGQNINLSAISGFSIKPERQETITPTSGGLLTNSDISGFKLNIPANALGTGSNANTIKTQNNTAVPNPSIGTALTKNAVTVSAIDSSGQPVKNLNDDVTIVIPYTEADIPSGLSESSLVIGVWNDATQSYDSLATTVDTSANTLTATVSHFSDFVPLINSDAPAQSSSESASVSSSASTGSGSGGGGGSPGSISISASMARPQIIYPDGRVEYVDTPALTTSSGQASVSQSPKTSYSRLLVVGSEGADVSALQSFLEKNGFLILPQGIAKGYFGAMTKKALAKYQVSAGLEAVGELGPKTRKLLNLSN